MEDFKKELDSNTVIVGDFNTQLLTMDRSSKQRINKEILAIKNSLHQMAQLMFTEHFIPKKQNIHYFQIHMDQFQ